MDLFASFSSLSKTPPPFSLASPFSPQLFLHPNAPQPLRFLRNSTSHRGIFLRKPPSFSRQINRAIAAAQASNQKENDNFVLEDVPHLTNFLPDLPSYPNLLQKSQAYSIVKKTFVSPEDVVAQNIVIQKDSPRGVHFRRAGPREKVYFKPEEVRACIVTCGGLCPGINTVIREIVCGLNNLYGVEDILGIEGGYRGFYSKNTIRLTPKVVNDIHKRGGTFLRTSRGGHDTYKIVDNIEDRGINQVYIIGGDGTQKGAALIYEEVEKRGLQVAVAGIPKTIDNDIAVIDKSFGFDTAVEEAQRAINAAHVEVESVENGVGIVKLMGRYSGFIAMYATLASRDVDCCLIPESPFYLEGSGGLFEFIEHRLKENGHLVIVVAEGAGQEYVAAEVHTAEGKDASGNKLLLDVGLWLSDKIKVLDALSRLFLVFSSLLFYILSNSHFVAAAQLLIYVGAINVLIIFAVMFMNGSEYYQDFPLWTVGDGITLMVCASIFVSLITTIPDTSWYRIIWTTRPNQIIEQDLISINQQIGIRYIIFGSVYSNLNHRHL